MLRQPSSVFLIRIAGLMRWLAAFAAGMDFIAISRAQVPSADNALSMYQAATSSIRSFDVYLVSSSQLLLKEVYSGTPGEPDFKVERSVPYLPGEAPKPQAGYYHQSYRDDRIRIDTLDGIAGAVIESIESNGETEKCYDPKQSMAVIRPIRLQWLSHSADYRCSYLNFLGNIPLVGCLRDRTNIKCWLENGLCHLESDGGRNNKGRLPMSGVHVGFDPQHGFLPALIEEYRIRDGKRIVFWRTRIESFHQVSGGFVPLKTVTQVFETRPLGPMGQILAIQTVSVDLDRSTWNRTVPDRRFDISIPAGVRVIDNVRNVRFLTGKSDPGQNIDTLISNAKEAIAFHPAQVSEPTAGFWHWIVIAAIVLLVVAISGYWYRRRAAGRRSYV